MVRRLTILSAVAASIATSVACAPQRLDSVAEVDSYIARGNYAYACIGLQARKDDLRAYTAQRLARFESSEDATTCLCEAVYDADTGEWDPAVAKGLEDSRRDDLAACLQPAANDARVTDRAELVAALGAITAPAGFEGLAQMVRTETDEAVRAAAVAALRPSKDHVDLLRETASAEPTAIPTSVRAAAARALEGHGGSAVVGTLRTLATTDPESAVRLAAVEVLADEADDRMPRETLCTVMMEDGDPAVRRTAVQAFQGTTSSKAVRCLRKRLLTREEDGGVREAVLEVLGSSPRDEAADALCEAVHPVLRMYVKDKVPGEIPGTEIMEAQNNRDYERSWECVSKASARGGLSCYARNYLAHWINDLGGSARPPRCPGMGAR